MIIQKHSEFKWGYTPNTSLDELHSDMPLDFGILKQKKAESYHCNLVMERAWLLLKEKLTFIWPDGSATGQRSSCIDIKADEDCKIVLERCKNDQVFPVKFNATNDAKLEVFGVGVLNEASNRTVRTVFDGENAPYSNMVLGEVINHPGRWSSYPPHDHPHPEIYYYRFFPKQGFGFSVLDEDAFVVHDGDSYT